MVEITNPPEVLQSPIPVPNADLSQKIVTSSAEYKKKKRKKVKLILLLLILVPIALVLLIKFATQKRIEYAITRPSYVVKETTQSEKPAEPSHNDWLSFSFLQLGFSFQYPKELHLERSNPFSADPPTFKAIFKGKNQPDGLINETTLVDGYIYKVIINKNVSDKSLLEIVTKKRESYIFNCNELTKASDIVPTKVDGLDGFTFNVSYCVNDYKETFVTSKNYVYEISQAFKGDLGYKQLYEKTTDEILTTMKIDREAPPAEDPFVYYEDGYGVKFKHPRLDANCCAIPAPAFGKLERTITLADVQGLKPEQGKPFDGFSMFIDKNENLASFEDYLKAMKDASTAEYRLVLGKNPEGADFNIKIGNIDAVLLKGYAWWGDIIVAKMPYDPYFLVLAKTDYVTGSFNDVFNGILSTFEFRDTKLTL